MPAQVSVTYEDSEYRYRLTAQATGPTSAGVTQSKTDKNTQAVINSTYEVTGIEVVNGVLTGTVHLLGALTESFTMTLFNETVTIQTGGLLFGAGAQTLGPYTIGAQTAGVAAWEAGNFPHS